jgi:hypothetical protein
MEEEKFNRIIKRYGRELSKGPKYDSVNVESTSYPDIAMRHIAIECLKNEDIAEIHKTGEYCILKSRKEFMEILDSFNKYATSNKNELNDFVNYLIGKRYNVGNGFNIKFEQNKSNLEIILEKRK